MRRKNDLSVDSSGGLAQATQGEKRCSLGRHKAKTHSVRFSPQGVDTMRCRTGAISTFDYT
ncbi:MAG: hypothetical protein AB7S52_09330 [Sphaerochaetaceae bacterium]